ncbi:MAG: CRISPR-associated RAMP protein Csx7 [Calothrix sp. MO_192.B10]|nr:CRISPR-associated RAMP protein Csx7 [Calothrix sp. MO_192.B10]
MFDTFRNRLELIGTLTTVTALRISAGRSSEPIGSDLPVIKDALGNPLIPGSSFKGAMRSRLESFLRGIIGNNRKFVANPAIEDEWSLTSKELGKIKGLNLQQLIILYQLWALENFQRLSLETLIEYIHDEDLLPEDKEKQQIIKIKELNLDQLITLQEARKADEFINFSIEELIQHIQEEYSLPEDKLKSLKKQYNYDFTLTCVIQKNTDFISSLFGSPWIASKFQVRDLTVKADTWFGQYQERDGVSIDRDTETAAEGKLYDFQVVPAGTQFEFKAIVENAEDWELGLLMIGLHQFETEQIPLGGGRSRGLGVVKLDISEMLWFDYPPEQPHLLLDYLKKLVMGDKSAYEDAREFKDNWVQKLIDKLTNTKSSDSITETKR